MALVGNCTNCDRIVYVAEDDTPICPVCSTPLLSAVKDIGEPVIAEESTEE
jgi:RNA polymerase subunit RPABC4/transcription elongation factor Spt4